MSDKGAQDRLQRESEFHDGRYRDDPRTKLSPFYRATTRSRDDFTCRLAAIPDASTVLELGVGVKPESYDLARRGCSCTLVDISPVAVARVATESVELGLDIEAVCTDAHAPDLPKAQFDYIIGNGIVHHLEIDRLTRMLEERLSANGIALFAEPLGVNPAINLFRRMTPSLRSEDEEPLRPSHFAKLGSGSLVVIEARFYTCLALVPAALRYRFPWFRIPTAIEAMTDYIDSVLLHGSIPTRWLAWMVVFEMHQGKGISGERSVGMDD